MPAPIKTMKLYAHFERVDRELKELGFEEGSELKAESIFAFDHMNYYGTDAVNNACITCGITEEMKVLDIGSGLGGPARFINMKTNAEVEAIELQQDCSDKAKEYTGRCGKSEKIKHICADFVTCDLPSLGLATESFDVLVSWLVFLHIEQKQELFERAAAVAKKGGQFYIEDFFARGSFTATETESLKRDVFCSTLVSKDEYCKLLTDAGFQVISFDDVTDSWTDFVTKRNAKYVDNMERTLRVHGQDTYDTQLYFFNAVRTLFQGGNLGGCRIVARKI